MFHSSTAACIFLNLFYKFDLHKKEFNAVLDYFEFKYIKYLTFEYLMIIFLKYYK